MNPAFNASKHRLIALCAMSGAIALLSACGGGDGTDGLSGQSIALRTSAVGASTNCVSGGNRFDAGPDDNRNGVLEDAEVTASTFVCNGVNGAVGATGVTGAPGAAGATGATGATGAAGVQGATGATGPAGTAGATGPAGATGATGPAGAAGANGTPGVAGPVGATGPIGATGPAGAVGATGATGPAGAIGATGATGSAGATGPQGAGGATGTTRFIRITTIGFGSPECAFGGTATEVGIDTNNDTVFDAAEVLSRTVVCNVG
jgi:Collagen triple helix repeat (20 copies)